MSTKILILLFIFCYSDTFGNNQDSLLLIEQINSTKKLYRELRNYAEETNKLEETYSKDLITIQEVHKNVIPKIENINSGIQNVATQLENIKDETKKDSFKWWSFLSSALAELIGAFVGVLSALYIFFRESKRDEKIKKDDEARENEDRMNYFGSLLHSTKNITNNTIEGLEKYTTKMDENPILVPLLPINPKQELERLGELINDEKYYYAFLKKFGNSLDEVKKYKGLVGAIDFLNSQFDQLYEIQENIQKFDYERKMKYKSIFDKVRDEAAEIGKRSQQTIPELYSLIGDVLQNYYQNLEPYNLEYHQNQFVEPLKRGIIDNGFLQMEEGRYISNQLKNATLIFTEIQEQNKSHSSNFKEIKSTMETVIESVNKNGKELTDKFKKKNTAANKG